MSIPKKNYSELWVCFEPPDRKPPPEVLILSFMNAGLEDEYEKIANSGFVSGRSVAQEIRADARKAYLKIITQPVATPCLFNKTLRESLKGRDGVSRWWYTRLSQKNSVGVKDHYTSFIQLYCVKTVAERHSISDILLFGASRNFAKCLRESYSVSSVNPYGKLIFIQAIFEFLSGIAGRIYFIMYYLYLLFLLKRLPAGDMKQFNILLQGYWEWSFMASSSKELSDKYFSDLPEKVREMGYSVGWLARLSDETTRQNNSSLRKSVYKLRNYTDVVIIERFLKISDVFCAALNIKYLTILLVYLLSKKFRSLFILDGLNFYPVVMNSLISSFAGNDVAHNELFSIGAERVCLYSKPKVIITFLELFLFSRAIYSGAKRANRNIKIYTAQHAAYCSEKTFGFLDKHIEVEGFPDNCPMPIPDGIFTMGELSYSLWRDNGYAVEQVLNTGGLRYQHIKITTDSHAKKKRGDITILMICGMNEYLDFDMCEAVCRATEGISSIKLRIRDHPFYNITNMDTFGKYKSRIEVSTLSSSEDILSSDIILFTHSSLAEEALLMGVPIWQWLWAGFNTSVFVDIPVIPIFTSIEKLKNSIIQFMNKPESFRPSEEIKRFVLKKCFGTNPAAASVNIASSIRKIITS